MNSKRSTIFDKPGTSSGHAAVVSDIPGYVSPASGKWIEGRAARKEDLKATGSREVDPQEFTPNYSDKYYQKRGLALPEGRRQLSRREI